MPGTMSLVVAQVVHDVARELSLTQKDIERLCGVPQSQISRAYRGLRAFSIEDLHAISGALGVSMASLFDEAERRLERLD